MSTILRKNIYSLTPEEVSTFVDGIKKLKASTDSLPYWDWTNDQALPSYIGPLWDPNMFGSPAEKERSKKQSPVVTGPFAYTSGWKTVPYKDHDLNFGEKLKRFLPPDQ